MSIHSVLLIPLNELLSGHHSHKSGICNYVKSFITNHYNSIYNGLGCSAYNLFVSTMKEACVDWEHYSGDVTYPIKHPEYTGGVDNDVLYVDDDGDVIYKSERSDVVYKHEYGEMFVIDEHKRRDIFHSNEEAAYEMAVCDNYGGYFNGEYGRRRLELVQRMIDILKGKNE